MPSRARFNRETSGAITFDAALEAYINGGDAEELLRAAALVLGSNIPLDEKLAETIGRAVRRWFALMGEPGARH